MTPTVLALRALGLGDFLTGVPALRALRRGFPGHRLVLAAPEALSPLLPLTGAVDELLPTAPLLPLSWSGPPPDVAVNLHGRGPQSHAVLAALRPVRTIAFGSGDAPGPTWRADEHEVARWCRLLDESGVPSDPTDLRLASPGPPLPGLAGATVVHPGAASEARRWPWPRYAEVARVERAAGRVVVVTGSTSERMLAARVATAAGLPREHVLAGRTDLGALARLVAHAGLVVCGDTGVAHLATAFSTPSVVLFGPVAPAHWGPPPSPRHRVLWSGSTGDPHGTAVDPGLARIAVADVLSALGALRAGPAVRRDDPLPVRGGLGEPRS